MLRRTLEFMLYDWLDAQALTRHPRYTEHTRETFEAVLDTSERIAREEFAPYNRIVDVDEPRLVGDRVIQPACAKSAADAFVSSGLIAAGQDYEVGGSQLPYVVELAAHAFFGKASIGLHGGNMLTIANANLLLAHGTDTQKHVFAANQLSGRWFGTMCLSEPGAGSALSDITTRAHADGEEFDADPLGPRYRLTGNKMWISNGDHELSENIVHLVLAKIPGPDGALVPGVRGISLFVVPKWMVERDGRMTGERNDVAVAGLNHKLGHRGVPNTLLNFGEGRYAPSGAAGAVGYRVGAPGDGLRCMFHMMNEARIAIGLYASSIGFAGYELSLGYAQTRRQGRHPRASGKDAHLPPVPIIEHADVKRMLLAQKAFTEGGLGLALFLAREVDRSRVGSAGEVQEAKQLLELLTPIAKSWASEWCLEANSLAIQILGGYGYTKDFLVELLWRDNRLNMIHEGTHGIQAIDLLGRKVRMNDGSALEVLERQMADTLARARSFVALESMSGRLEAAWHSIREGARAAWATDDAALAVANATPFMQAFGHGVIAWIWLDMAVAALKAGRASEAQAWSHGKCRAARYFFDYELPKIDAWLKVVAEQNRTCMDAPEASFAD